MRAANEHRLLVISFLSLKRTRAAQKTDLRDCRRFCPVGRFFRTPFCRGYLVEMAIALRIQRMFSVQEFNVLGFLVHDPSIDR